MSKLQRRGDSYYFRQQIPRALRPAFGGKWELVYPLGRDAAQARIKMAHLAAEVEAELARVQAGIPSQAEVDAKLEQWRQWIDRNFGPPEAPRYHPVSFTMLNPAGVSLPVPAPQEATEKLSAVHAALMAERKPAKSLEAGYKLALQRFTNSNDDLPVRTITKAHIRKFKDDMAKLGLSDKTINKNLAHLQAHFTFAYNNDWMSSDPIKGLMIKIDDREKKPLPFTDDELQLIFSSLSKLTRIEDYWIPVLAVLGARVEEISQLRPQDIAKKDGMWCMAILHEAGSVKNKTSERTIPLHQIQLDAGLLKYVESRKGKERLFDLPVDPMGRRSRAYSSRFSEFKKSLGVKDSKKTFHSIRHSFNDIRMRCGLSEEVYDAITGRSAGGRSGRGYGSGWTVENLKREIDRIQFPFRIPRLTRLRQTGKI